jgi:hypothetical protein
MYYLFPHNFLVYVQESTTDGTHTVATFLSNGKIQEKNISYSFSEWQKLLKQDIKILSAAEAQDLISSWSNTPAPYYFRIEVNGKLSLSHFHNGHTVAWTFDEVSSVLDLTEISSDAYKDAPNLFIEELDYSKAVLLLNEWAYRHLEARFIEAGSTFLYSEESGGQLRKIVGFVDETQSVILADAYELNVCSAIDIFSKSQTYPPKLNSFKDFPTPDFWDKDYSHLYQEFKSLPILASFLIENSRSLFFKTSSRNYLEVGEESADVMHRSSQALKVLPVHQSFGIDLVGEL